MKVLRYPLALAILAVGCWLLGRLIVGDVTGAPGSFSDIARKRHQHQAATVPYTAASSLADEPGLLLAQNATGEQLWFVDESGYSSIYRQDGKLWLKNGATGKPVEVGKDPLPEKIRLEIAKLIERGSDGYGPAPKSGWWCFWKTGGGNFCIRDSAYSIDTRKCVTGPDGTQYWLIKEPQP